MALDWIAREQEIPGENAYAKATARLFVWLNQKPVLKTSYVEPNSFFTHSILTAKLFCFHFLRILSFSFFNF